MGEVRLIVPRLRLIKGRYFWRPTAAVKGLGFAAEALGRDMDLAIGRARELNALVEAARRGETAPAQPTRETLAALIAHYRKSRLRAADMVPGILAKQPGLLEQFEAAHRADCESFDFRCERYGDFLAIFVKRGPKEEGRWAQPNHIATTINLGLGATVELIEGHAPDMLDSRQIDGNLGRDSCKLAESWPDIYPRHSRLSDPPTQTGYQDCSGDFFCCAVPNCARPAGDDRIVFCREKTLNVPAGLGADVYAKILAALPASG